MATVPPQDEIRRVATIFGAHDPEDALLFGDWNGATVGGDIYAGMNRLKAAKPHLFRNARDMTPEARAEALREAKRRADSGSRPPAPPSAKKATDMLPAERAEWLKRHKAAHR
jgi:hypothetical protein